MPTYEEWKKENWDRAHRENALSALTGTSLGGHLNTLGAVELLEASKSILCIGIGTGEWIHSLVDKTPRTIWALDISLFARSKIPQGVRFVTGPECLPTNQFDLALSLWVAPHMTDHDLQEQLSGVIRSLKPTGVLAIHYKEPLHDEQVIDNRAGAKDEFQCARSAMMLRRRRHFADMVKWAGGYVIKTALENPSHFYQIIEASAHVGRSK